MHNDDCNDMQEKVLLLPHFLEMLRHNHSGHYGGYWFDHCCWNSLHTKPVRNDRIVAYIMHRYVHRCPFRSRFTASESEFLEEGEKWGKTLTQEKSLISMTDDLITGK